MRKDVSYNRGIVVDPGNAIDWDFPVNRGLVGRWQVLPNIAAGGRWVDLAGQNHGTLTNMGTGWGWKPTSRGGAGGQVNFDGSSSFVQLGAANYGAVLTIAAWMRPTTLPSVSSIIGWTVDGGPQFRVETSGSPRWVKQNNADIGLGTAGSVVAGMWSRVVGSYNSTTGAFAFWVNGKPQGSGTNIQAVGYSSPRIGRASSVDYLDGAIDDVRVITRYWTNADAIADFDDSSTGYRSSLRWFSTRSYSLPASGSSGVGTSSGTSTAAAVGASTSASVASSTGVATSQATGRASIAGVGSTAGTATSQAVGASSFAGVGSSTGGSTCQAVGAASTAGVASSTGSATGTATGSSAAASVASSAGSATAQAVGQSTGSGAGVASSAGTSSASAVGAASVRAIFSSIGQATVNGVSPGGLSIDGRYGTAYDMGSRTASAVDLGSRTATAIDMGSRSVIGRAPN